MYNIHLSFFLHEWCYMHAYIKCDSLTHVKKRYIYRILHYQTIHKNIAKHANAYGINDSLKRK